MEFIENYLIVCWNLKWWLGGMALFLAFAWYYDL